MKPTNLLVLMSDEHNPKALGCYGHPMVKTPHLDALAERGTRFDTAYCNSPVCIPARAVFATGKYIHQLSPSVRIGEFCQAFEMVDRYV